MYTWSQIGEDDNDDRVDLYAAFGKDSSYYGTVGVAWVGGACTGYYKTSFNEYRDTASENAYVMVHLIIKIFYYLIITNDNHVSTRFTINKVVAHEMGHNFGMSHDFDDKHGGTDGACNGQGIMSYGDYLTQWSDCSVSDFTGYYENQLWGEKCLASKCSSRHITNVFQY